MKNKRTFLLHLLFVFYLAALTWIILFKMAVSFDTIDHGIRSLNLIPFKGAMITNGRSDITDVIMNTVGGIVGLLIYSLLNKICRNERMTEIVVFICAAFGSAAVSGFLLAIFHAN